MYSTTYYLALFHEIETFQTFSFISMWPSAQLLFISPMV